MRCARIAITISSEVRMTNLFQHLTLEDARLLLAQDITIVDIRDSASYVAGHITEAISLNDQNLTEFIQQADFDKPLLVYCYHGHSSQPAAQFLAEQGFDEVYSLIGGYTAWRTTFPEN
jgi:thiosulfate sulfurtransferase